VKRKFSGRAGRAFHKFTPRAFWQIRARRYSARRIELTRGELIFSRIVLPTRAVEGMLGAHRKF
jgi:hypothetical protein